MLLHPLLAVITMPLDPIIFRLGGLAVHWYGLFIALGIMVNVPLARIECARKGISEDTVFNLAVWAVIFGIIGGRLYYVVQADQPGGFAYYLQHPQQILATWEGGMAFYGMVFAVFLTVVVYCWRTKAPFWDLMDMAAVFFPLGQVFGRLGNVVNGDIVGYPSTLPWAIRYPNPNALAPDHVTAFQPASIYELLFSLALFLFLWSIRKRVKIPGMLFAYYVFLYSLGQFAIFYLRDNSITILDLKQAQVTALLVMIATLPLMAYLLRRAESGPGAGGGEREDAPAQTMTAPPSSKNQLAAVVETAPAGAVRAPRPRTRKRPSEPPPNAAEQRIS
ncbi:MAG: prolipoprotein diacylglyceryl transferase [Chloroflexota bacterium]|nr:prolipoprotein diacylglyceryl transferase [Chloroflexota bacterium]